MWIISSCKLIFVIVYVFFYETYYAFVNSLKAQAAIRRFHFLLITVLIQLIHFFCVLTFWVIAELHVSLHSFANVPRVWEIAHILLNWKRHLFFKCFKHFTRSVTCNKLISHFIIHVFVYNAFMLNSVFFKFEKMYRYTHVYIIYILIVFLQFSQPCNYSQTVSI